MHTQQTILLYIKQRSALQSHVPLHTLRHGGIFINGIPVVVFEFKSAVREDTTIMDAYTQLTVRYLRFREDIDRSGCLLTLPSLDKLFDI